MSKIEELQKRVERLEIEVDLLRELIRLLDKSSSNDKYIPTSPTVPMQPYFTKEPTLEPPYKFTCKGGEE